MKKKTYFSVAALVIFGSALSFAQEKDKIRVGAQIGYAAPQGGGGGILIEIEPKYNLEDNMAVGFRWQSAAMAKQVVVSNSSGKASLAASSSFLGTFDYYFNKSSSFVPYVGAGLGLYIAANASLSANSSGSGGGSASGGSTFGGLARGGFETGKFRLTLEYNLVPATKSTVNVGSIAAESSTKNSYLGISIGFFVGGGKWGQKGS